MVLDDLVGPVSLHGPGGGEVGARETGQCHSAGFKDGVGPRTKDCCGLWKCEEGREHCPWSLRKEPVLLAP